MNKLLKHKPKTTYFEKEDILHLVISDDSEGDSLELTPNVTAKLNENSKLIRIEILDASTFIQDTILGNNFAKVLLLRSKN